MIKIVAILLPVLGIVAGGAAGYFTRSAPDAPPDAATADMDADAPEEDPSPEGSIRSSEGYSGDETDFVPLSNQFVIPVLDEGQLIEMMILTLSVETEAGTTERVYSREPKLRDALLRVLFDHASVGGFDGNFLSSAHVAGLRRALREVAIGTVGSNVKDVLIMDMVKQPI